jgi:hypothetical protein
MDASYGDEVSNLKISKIVGEFMGKHIRNFGKRIFYNYYLRDMSLASLELPLGVTSLLFGLIYGGLRWVESSEAGVATPAGTVTLSAPLVIMGIQLILAFFLLRHRVRAVAGCASQRPVREEALAWCLINVFSFISQAPCGVRRSMLALPGAVGIRRQLGHRYADRVFHFAGGELT